MEFLRRKSVEIAGHHFEVREVSIAMRREIEAATKLGGDTVEETLRRCVFYEGQALGADAQNLGFSFATPLVLAIQELANEGVVLPTAPLPVLPTAPAANGADPEPAPKA